MTPHAAAVLWLGHVLAVHLNVPEPVRFELREAVPGFEARHDAVCAFEAGTWVVRYDPERFRRSTAATVRLVVAHEVCHAVYNHTPGVWGGLSAAEQAREHLRVKACARNVLDHHRRKVNHAKK